MTILLRLNCEPEKPLTCSLFRKKSSCFSLWYELLIQRHFYFKSCTGRAPLLIFRISCLELGIFQSALMCTPKLIQRKQWKKTKIGPVRQLHKVTADQGWIWAHLQWHTSSIKATPPNPFQTGDQVLKHTSLWAHSHSNFCIMFPAEMVSSQSLGWGTPAV